MQYNNGFVDPSRRSYPMNKWGQASREFITGTRGMSGNKIDHRIRQHDGPNTLQSLSQLAGHVGPIERNPSGALSSQINRHSSLVKRTANAFSVHGTRRDTTEMTKRIRTAYKQAGLPVNVNENGFKHGPMTTKPTQPIQQSSQLSLNQEVWDRHTSKSTSTLKVFFPVEMPVFRLAHASSRKKRFPLSVNLLSIAHLNAKMKFARETQFSTKNVSAFNTMSEMKQRLSFHGIGKEVAMTHDNTNERAARLAFIMDGPVSTYNFWNECNLKPSTGCKLYFILVRVRMGCEHLERQIRSGHFNADKMKSIKWDDFADNPSYLRLEPYVGHRPPPARLYSSFGLGEEYSRRLYGEKIWIGRSFYVGHAMDKPHRHMSSPQLNTILYPDNIQEMSTNDLTTMVRLRVNVE